MNPEYNTEAINGCRIYYEWGGQGQPVVFVHGGFPNLMTELCRNERTSGSWTWEQDFARDCRFVWYDRRGCYRSSCPTSGYDLETQAHDFVALLNLLNIESAHIIGSSAGGPISVVISSLYPARIRSLTLVGTGLDLFPTDDPATQAITQYMESVAQQGSSALIDCRPPGTEVSLDALWEPEEFEARGESESYQTRQSELRRRALSMPETVRKRFYDIELQAIASYRNTDLCVHTDRVTCPTAVIHGSNDRMVPLPWAQDLATHIRDAQLTIVDGGPHGMVFRSSEVRQQILAFLRNSQDDIDVSG